MDPKAVVTRFVEEAVNGGRDELIGELFAPELEEYARDWFGAFRASFPDVHMDILELVAEGDTVVGRFECSATHLGEWRDHAPTGRRFEKVDEVYFFKFSGGRIEYAWGLEDKLDRLQQQGLDPPAA